MKVVDMFGSGLPVCAIAFPTLPELVRHGENGFIFQTPLELKDRLFELLIAEGHERVLEGLRKVGSFLFCNLPRHPLLPTVFTLTTSNFNNIPS